MSYATYPRRSSRTGIKYRETEVLSASPSELVVVVYDHLLASLLRARAAIVGGAIEARVAEFGRARDAVAELLATLDRKQGGEVANQLAGLYAFFLKELASLGVDPQVDRLDRVIAMIRDLREAFVAIQTGAAR